LHRVGDRDVDLAKPGVRGSAHRFAPDEPAARLQGDAFARAERRPRIGNLGERQAVLGDPQRERALLEECRGIRRLRDRAHARGKRNREDGQRHEDFDQREP